ncbi:Ribosome biogenesis ATPase rix7, partial [Rhizina undulata]
MPLKPRSFARNNSLSKSLDNKVLAVVRRYVDEKSAEQEDSGGSLRLSVSAIYQYVIADGSVPRQKKQNIEKAIQRAIEVLRNEGTESEEATEIDSDFEGLNEEGLMEPKETNKVNKRIVEMWAVNNKAPTSSSASPQIETPAMPALEEAPALPAPAEAAPAAAVNSVAPSPRKRKERTVNREEASKRQKADKESRDPPKNITLKDLGGVEDVVNELLELIGMPLTHPEVYTHTGVQPPRGVLLHGPPGCGKTMLANAIAGELGLPFISVSAPSIVSG